jgi:hypothetical protein
MRLELMYDYLESKGYTHMQVPEITFRMRYSEFLKFKNDSPGNLNLGLGQDDTSDCDVNFSLYPPVYREDLVARLVLESEDKPEEQFFRDFTDLEIQEYYLKTFGYA